jgi:hypothetical protein
MMTWRVFGIVVGGVLIVLPMQAGWAGSGQGAPAQQLAATSNQDDAAAFIAKYGKPDVDGTDAFNRAHPTVVSRFLVYKKENVHIYYLPGGTFGAQPPYGPWKLLTYQDERTRGTLTLEEVEDRMQDRLSQKAGQ